MVSNQPRIVREIHIDDGTTLGKKGYVDQYGRTWVETYYSKENSPTGVEVRTIQPDGTLR